MDKIYEQTMLFDFYGELLTEHQRSVYIDAVYNDLSLGEIAEERGISRQGVHDLIKRCDRILRDYEGKLHLVERFAGAKEIVREIQRLSETVEKPKAAGEQELRHRLQRIGELSKELLEEL
ncbi:MAG: YlxM family DNA-binding protein [Butyrivibrio sp.]|nr:YlxM family DNA-binding protein [Acetatifactor muris]MCM1558501.1 YlxM family DNA-binding protein [Butyrivibrio sp.]